MNRNQCRHAISYISPGPDFGERTVAFLYLSQRQRGGKGRARRFIYIGLPVAAAVLVALAVFIFPRDDGARNVSLPAGSNGQAAFVDSPAPSMIPSPSAALRNISCADKVKIYTSALELYRDSDTVFTGTCISAHPVFQNETLYTLAQYTVEAVFKGDVQPGDVISIVEMGGTTTYGDYAKYCIPEKKPGDGDWEDYHSPGEPLFLRGGDGGYPSVAGDKVLLFAGDAGGFLGSVKGPLYGILGGIDGKFYDRGGGVYARALPASTDKPVFTGDKAMFGDAELRVTLEELRALEGE